MKGPFDDSITLLASPWSPAFYDLVGQAQYNLLIASPFIGREPLNRVIDILASKQSLSNVRIDVITNFSVDSMLSGALDVAALLRLAKTTNSTIAYLPSLHAKVYVADSQAAVVTSANLTHNGLVGNREYGVLLRDPTLVARIRADVQEYALLGSTVSMDSLTALAQATQDLKAIQYTATKSIKQKLKAAFEQRTEEVKLELLKVRALGKTTQGIFSDTFIYLLREMGPLTTIELHPLIQQLHPDLCDDTIDRVIGGVHFGKKWKHYVRNAQQSLKRKGAISFDGQRWFLINA